MKKNISINIGGIIFHIEEDGYERLKKYLDSINQYFASFEDRPFASGSIAQLVVISVGVPHAHITVLVTDDYIC